MVITKVCAMHCGMENCSNGDSLRRAVFRSQHCAEAPRSGGRESGERQRP
jgi:hypothetical protein